jgi:hypothetical protein
VELEAYDAAKPIAFNDGDGDRAGCGEIFDRAFSVRCALLRIGTIAIRTGMPPGEDPWGWNCGFYPGSHPRECTDGTAATLEQARAWRDERDWTERKYAMWQAGERLPSQKPSSLTAPCGRGFYVRQALFPTGTNPAFP